MYFLKLHICVYVRIKSQFSIIILTSFRLGIVLAPPPQNEPLKHSPRLGKKRDSSTRSFLVNFGKFLSALFLLINSRGLLLQLYEIYRYTCVNVLFIKVEADQASLEKGRLHRFLLVNLTIFVRGIIL